MNDRKLWERGRKRAEGNNVRTLVIKTSEVSCCDIQLKYSKAKWESWKNIKCFLFINCIKREGDLIDYLTGTWIRYLFVSPTMARCLSHWTTASIATANFCSSLCMIGRYLDICQISKHRSVRCIYKSSDIYKIYLRKWNKVKTCLIYLRD